MTTVPGGTAISLVLPPLPVLALAAPVAAAAGPEVAAAPERREIAARGIADQDHVAAAAAVAAVGPAARHVRLAAEADAAVAAAPTFDVDLRPVEKHGAKLAGAADLLGTGRWRVPRNRARRTA